MNRTKSESEQMGISKDSLMQDLVGLFELLSSLCRVDCHDRSFDRVHLAWRRFWSEVSRSVSQSVEAYNAAALCVTENWPLTSRPHLYSIGSIYRYSRSSGRGKAVPSIGISGLWLKDYGFHIHRKFEIYPEKNRLILRLASVLDPDRLPGSFPSCDAVSASAVIEKVKNARLSDG